MAPRGGFGNGSRATSPTSGMTKFGRAGGIPGGAGKRTGPPQLEPHHAPTEGNTSSARMMKAGGVSKGRN